MKLVIRICLAVLILVNLVDSMGLCFGGGYPKCCANGKNVCGPFCASCSRVGEFLRNMNMFDMMGFSMGTPAVFRIINNDPALQPSSGKPLPTNFNEV